MKVALAQMRNEGTMKQNLEKSILFIKEAAENNADIILFPEVQLTEFFPQYEKKDYIIKKYGKDVKTKEEAEKYLHINNLALENRPAGLNITTHVCRGNYQSAFAASGPYDTVAPILFANENVDAFYLEYDDERSGGFEPLKYVAEGKKVVLGLITSKRPDLEDKEKVIERIYEASKYVPLENLYLSPQCGFSSNEIGNKLTEDEQWAKLKLVKEIAEEVWNA